MAHRRDARVADVRVGARRRAAAALALGVLAVLLAIPLAAPASAASPAAPTGLGFNLQNNQATLFTWTASPGADRYKLTCEKQGFTDLNLTVFGVTSTTAMLPTVATQCFVRAGNGVEWSGPSTSVVVTVGAMSAPTGLSATAYSGVVDLYWDVPSGQRATSWQIKSVPATTTSYLQLVAVTGSSAHLTLAGVPVGVAHTFTVQPIRTSDMGAELGTSASFNPITVGQAPGAPTVTNVDSDAYAPTGIVDVSWLPPTANGSPAIDKYRVVLHRGENDDIVREYDSTDRRAFIELPGLSGIEIEGVGVQARNANGWGPLGGWPGGSVFLVRKPSPPENLSTQVDSSKNVRVQWDTPDDVDGYYDPPQFEVVIDGPTPDDEVVVDQEQYVGSATLSDGWYQAKVRAKGELNDSRWVSRWFAVGTPCDPDFSDVPAGHAFCTPISWLVRSEIGDGFPDGTFQPTASVSRQAVAAFLYRLKAPMGTGSKPTCSVAPFPDVPITHPFCGEIAWLVGQGITAGYGDGTFRPSASVTRQALASFLYKASGQDPLASPAVCTNGFPAATDVPVDHAFCQYVAWIIDAGTASGYPDGTFRPSAPVSRQAMASFLSNWRP